MTCSNSIVVIALNRKLATTLIYDGQIESFIDVDGVPYNVKYWALLPEPPEER